MSLFVLGFLAGALVCASFPQFADWLRGCAEAVGLFLQRAVGGVRPHRANIPIRAQEGYTPIPVVHQKQGAKSDSAPFMVQMASVGGALSNIGAFLGGCLKFAARHPRLVICLIVAVLWIPFWSGLRLPFGESREHAIARANQAESEVHTKTVEIQRNERIGEAARDVAVARVRIQVNSQRGHDEIAAHTPEIETPLDPALVSAWRSAIDRLCVNARPDGSFPDSCGSSAPS